MLEGQNDFNQAFESPESQQAQLNQGLGEFGAFYNPEFSLEQNQRRLTILQRMKETGVISFTEEGDLLFDSQNPTVFQKYDEKQQKVYQTPEVVEALWGVKGCREACTIAEFQLPFGD